MAQLVPPFATHTASCTVTFRPLPPWNVRVAVAVLLSEPCEFFAWYVKVIVDEVPAAGGVVGTAVKEPSAFKLTVPPLGAPTMTALIGNLLGSTSLPRTPGAAMRISAAFALVNASLLATGPVPTVLD